MSNGLTVKANREIGSVTYKFVSLGIFLTLLGQFGFSVANTFVFAAISGISYFLVGFVFKIIGFWPHWKQFN